jgi:hypothetical protein
MRAVLLREKLLLGGLVNVVRSIIKEREDVERRLFSFGYRQHRRSEHGVLA